MEKVLPIYRLTIKDEDDKMGVNYVALVDEPAIQTNWLAFNGQMKFAMDKERKIITGALMLADLPIYRRSEKMGEFYVVFDKFQIEKIVQRFMKNGFTDNVNKMHDAKQTVDGVYMYESFIVDSQRGIRPPVGFEDAPEGSWFGSYKVDNEDVWNNFIKTGEFKGFSVEGVFDLVPEGDAKEKDIMKQIVDIIASITE
jgi:hypothetical protein